MATTRAKKVLIHPVVLFSIVDSFERRNEEAKRVIGTLLGVVDKGLVEVKSCFGVPHNESADEVAVELEYAKSMFELSHKANPKEQIVGWYATGPDVTEHSLLIHEYYSRETNNPIHLTVDTTLKGHKMGIKAYQSVKMGVPEKTEGTIFSQIPCEIKLTASEKVGVEVLQRTKIASKKSVSLISDMQHVTSATDRLLNIITDVISYVENVINGKIVPDNAVGRELTGFVEAVPKMTPDEFESMLNSNMQDLLMIVYLANLCKTQLALGEKLNAVL
ncbi:eukaryotic translation initiation factor 3 subunit F [Exaiptasia diaphana]|uniref:Eukaryotic translation initiation factor 3 subunit F n=1 Tax=Exaiptasia diaphana TaxID=2652724 RepID=A0A913XT91_EXADI|nr:eukaryotic translation initiation factor 3 subunit F [Exaiptasia diaphana]KXJ24911.1 Eukaryotic translation initiation factor 3 subunit F [Exaiptasia diaphana]